MDLVDGESGIVSYWLDAGIDVSTWFISGYVVLVISDAMVIKLPSLFFDERWLSIGNICLKPKKAIQPRRQQKRRAIKIHNHRRDWDFAGNIVVEFPGNLNLDGSFPCAAFWSTGSDMTKWRLRGLRNS